MAGLAETLDRRQFQQKQLLDSIMEGIKREVSDSRDDTRDLAQYLRECAWNFNVPATTLPVSDEDLENPVQLRFQEIRDRCKLFADSTSEYQLVMALLAGRIADAIATRVQAEMLILRSQE